MAERIYAHSPIREAVFDIRFKFDNSPEPSIFEEAYKAIATDYPKREVNYLQSVAFELKAGEQPKINSSGGQNGLRLTSVDGSQVVQFRTDGFTFSKLKPYNKWKNFLAEAKRLLAIYLDKAKPSYAERLALRYVNAIAIPENTFDLEDYFLTAPKVSPEIPQSLLHFFSRVMIKDDKSESLAVINQTVEENDTKERTTVLFDIDTFQPNIRVEPNSEELWARVDVLKQLRTRIFEGSITDKTRTLFD